MPFPVPFFNCAALVNPSASPVYFGQRGLSATITRNGAGDYTFTLDTPIDASQSLPLATLLEGADAASVSIDVLRPSDDTVRVRTRSGAALADLDFAFCIVPLNGTP